MAHRPKDSGIFSEGEYAKQAAASVRHATTSQTEHRPIDSKEYSESASRIAAKPHAPPLGQKEFRDPDVKTFTRTVQPVHEGVSRPTPTQKFNADHKPLNHGYVPEYKSTTHKEHKEVPREVIVEAASSVHHKPVAVTVEISVDGPREPLSSTARSEFTPKQSPRTPTAYRTGQENGQFGGDARPEYKSTTHKEHHDLPQEVFVEAVQSVHRKPNPPVLEDVPPPPTGPLLSTTRAEYTHKISPRSPRAFTMNQESMGDALASGLEKVSLSSTTRSTYQQHPVEEYKSHIKPLPSPRQR